MDTKNQTDATSKDDLESRRKSVRRYQREAIEKIREQHGDTVAEEARQAQIVANGIITILSRARSKFGISSGRLSTAMVEALGTFIGTVTPVADDDDQQQRNVLSAQVLGEDLFSQISSISADRENQVDAIKQIAAMSLDEVAFGNFLSKVSPLVNDALKKYPVEEGKIDQIEAAEEFSRLKADGGKAH